MRNRRQTAADTAQATRLERDHELQRRVALEQERTRMARELHDILAHSVSLMGVQAGAAEEVLSHDPESTRPILSSIQQTSRESVEELRRLLGMLRADELDPDRTPPAAARRVGRARGANARRGPTRRVARAWPVAFAGTGHRARGVSRRARGAHKCAQARATHARRGDAALHPPQPSDPYRERRRGLHRHRQRPRPHRNERAHIAVWGCDNRGFAAGRQLPRRRGNPSRGGTAMIRVLIADDQELVRAGFRMILDVQNDIEVVGEAGDGAAAVQAARTLDPDVVLMDVRMPDTDGIEATRRLSQAGVRARVLMLTTFDATNTSTTP